MTDQIDGLDVIAILGYLKGVQTDQLNELVMGGYAPGLYNPNALRQIVQRMKDLEESFDDGRETPRFDFDEVYAYAEKLIEMLEKDD